MLGSLFIVCDNILDASAKCRLNGDLVVFLHMDDICHNATDARYMVFLLHDAADAVSIAIVAFRNIP